jgi:pimeloyl-ACP methyl ester carboxylesterase
LWNDRHGGFRFCSFGITDCFRSWLKYFTVVQWDQRGSGRTFGRNGTASASTITPDRMAQDGVELAE